MVRTRHYSGKNKQRSEEGTRVFYGVETVVNTVLQFIHKTNTKIDACIDQTRPSLVIDITVLKEAFLDAKERGVYLRYITEITKDNLSYCKELLTMVGELRHLDGIKGNLYLSEAGYLAPATFHEKGKPAAQIIYSNVKEIVEHQTYVFDTLWTRAIPAEERFEQIEEGAGHEFVQIITNPQKASRVLSELVKSAKEEILLFLANDDVLTRIDKLGLVDQMIKMSQEANTTTIKIITPVSQQSSEIVNRINKRAPSIRILKSDSNSAFGMCIIDGGKLLRVETRQSDVDDFSGAIDFAIYSNRKLTVNSFKSTFELLWNERLLNEQLKIHDKMQSEFINIAAHELRTPIQSILGYTELLKEDKSKNILHLITPILKNAQRLEKLANDILDVTRIENKQLKLNLERFNIVDLIADIVQDFKKDNANAITSKHNSHRFNSRTELIQLKYQLKEDVIFVEADKARITRVISNLLSNAIKFTKSGLITVKCRLERHTDEANDNSHHGNAIITIKDTGIGISQDIFHRLFTKFATSSNSGTGLGLFISKNIVEAHGGKIWAENNQNGSGASFSFTLPVVIAKNCN
ncbi:MAG TPA: HAMP domain-containing sensor histidine kinase [Nitrososphaeraceae archaeon]|nr:HAMP domain-containing sensor histidine kinase [Nitrososphaeraceae archaeon]